MPGSARARVPEPTLPRLLYVADVPVEASQHGSALMFRALESYPADRLRIVETGVASKPERRLPGVAYAAMPIGRRRWLDSRAHGIYSVWLTHSAADRAQRVIVALADFEADAVVTVGHGFGWLTAAAIAKRLKVPLHFIVHDDWPRLSAIPGVLRGWLDWKFGRTYRAAATRLCVSPFMAEDYVRRYRATAAVMYPSRSKDCPVFPAKAPRPMPDGDIVIGYGGNSSAPLVECLRRLAAALPGTRARLEVFGPFDEEAKRLLLAESPAISFRGFVPFQEMIRGLRDVADVLFVPMSFAEAERDNMTVSFPSKLADYTATGLPLLIYGPSYSSAARWARRYDDVAEIVDREDATALRESIERLVVNPERLAGLAERAVTVGRECFDAEQARASLTSALTHGRR